MINCQNVFDQPVRNNLRTYDSIWKIVTGQGDDYTTGRLLDYNYFSKYKKKAIDLGKQQTLDADLKAIQQINFTGNLAWRSKCTYNNIFHYWRSKRNHSGFFTRKKYYKFILLWYKTRQCNTVTVQLSNSKLNKLKSRIKNVAQGTINLSSNVIGGGNDEINVSHYY